MNLIRRNIWHYCTGDLFTIDETEYLFVEQDHHGITLETAREPRVTEYLTHDELDNLGQSERLKYLRDGAALKKNVALRYNGETEFPAIPNDPAQQQLLWKKFYCDELHRLLVSGHALRTDRSIAAVLEEISSVVHHKWRAMQKEGKKKRAGTDLNIKEEPSPRTLLRWFWRYERSGYRALGLQENYSKSGNRTQRFSPEAVALLTRCAQGYATRRRKTQQRIVEDTQAAFEKMNSRRLADGMRPWPIPGASTVRRAIGKLDKFYVACQRHGVDAARKKFAIFENGVSLLYPAERIEIDECEIDVMTLATTTFIWHLLSEEERKRVPRGRRWMYVAICATTRCILALHICKAPSGTEAVKCLALATRDKSDLARAAGAQCSWHQHAGLSSVVTDQGSAFIAFIFAQTVAALGGVHDAPAAATPWLRAFIERVFGTFNTDLFQEANGHTFSSPSERGDFDSQGTATLTDDQLAKMLIRCKRCLRPAYF